jgi:chromosome segregation ATPase
MERSMKRIFWLGMVLTTVLMLPACASQKKAAETALATATQAWNAIKAQAENIVPDEAKSIEDAISAATAQLQGGDDKGALAAATTLDSRIKELADALPGKTAQVQSAWAELTGSIPGTLATLEKKLKGLKAPAAGTPNAVQSPVVVLGHLKDGWSDAQAAAQGGRLAEAVSKANDVRTGAVKLLNDLQAGS